MQEQDPDERQGKLSFLTLSLFYYSSDVRQNNTNQKTERKQHAVREESDFI